MGEILRYIARSFFAVLGIGELLLALLELQNGAAGSAGITVCVSAGCLYCAWLARSTE